MNFLQIYKSFVFKKHFKKTRQTYYLSYNKESFENLEAITFASHHDLYRILRNFKTPFYDKCYFFRKKKGFNTLFFKQAYDVVITNKNNIIIETLVKVKTGFISKHYDKGFNIFFFVTGSIKNLNIKKEGELLIRSNITKLLFSKL